DLLVAGQVNFSGTNDQLDSTDLAALDVIFAEWTSSRSYSVRVNNIRGAGSGPRNNGTTFLKLSASNGTPQTVFDDAAVDTLTGSSGPDWFVGNLSTGVKDVITDKSSSEQTN